MSYKVLGIGDNVVDKYINKGIMYPGGNVLNFCVYTKMLGNKASLITKFGNDEIATYIKSVLDSLDIEYYRSRCFEGENGFAEVELIKGDRSFIRSNKGGVSKNNGWNFSDADENYIKNFSLVHSSLNSYIEVDLSQLATLQVPISYDFSVRWNDEYIKKVCPYIDIAFLSTSHLSRTERESEMRKFANLGVKIVVGTVGELGSYSLVKDNLIYQEASLQKEAKDTMGAGDAYLTAFLHELLSVHNGHIDFNKLSIIKDVSQAMKKGANFSAKVCQIEGAFGHGTIINK
ncbi:sugar/nucleoside kinase (ribokinase family) [Natronobacillus azotifigens]|uniref:PfkB family carbohydrate kinase n=1 Tax=Natronobacillus azotifigens TaxID=472978 RepID=A0A9J6RBG7_9BACI|nr:PfkB family carbohydrate kinase [Natronobacillus azotifigens]MCZ0703026.1 PfkB family carbohydrate kinase [Natronobacillus azotifigens]